MFYERYLKLCEGRRVNGKKLSPSAAAELCGFNRGTVSNWKTKYEQGKDVSPEDDVINKICVFFGCDEAWLRGIDGTKKAPTPEGERNITDDDRRILAGFHAADAATQEVIRRLIESR